MNNNPDDSSARMSFKALFEEIQRQRVIADRQGMIDQAYKNPGNPNYINNPWRQPMVQGGMGIRSLLGLDPTDQQRLEDAFYQFPTRNYGKMPER